MLEPHAGRDRGTELGAAGIEDLLAGSKREGEAAQRTVVVVHVDRAVTAGMIAEIVADDGFLVALAAIEECRISSQRLGAAKRGLPALVDVIVGVERRIVAQQDEVIAVPAIAKVKLRLLAQLLLQAGEPDFGSLPGVEVAIKLVGAKRCVAIAKHD